MSSSRFLTLATVVTLVALWSASTPSPVAVTALSPLRRLQSIRSGSDIDLSAPLLDGDSDKNSAGAHAQAHGDVDVLSVRGNELRHVHRRRDANDTSSGTAPNPTSPPGPIQYHGGHLLIGTPNVYFLWYGNWVGNTAGSILTNFITHLSGSPWFNIETTYYQMTSTTGKQSLSGLLNFAGSTNLFNGAYTQGKNLRQVQLNALVLAGIAAFNGGVPDSNGVYVLLTASDVTTPGFCSQFCGYHSSVMTPGPPVSGGTLVQYAFVGNPQLCLSGCSANSNASPNNNLGADAMASILAHELAEAFSDPIGVVGGGWYDNKGNENGDRCAWTFGPTGVPLSQTPNGAAYNVLFGGKPYLIQQNLVNQGAGHCAMHL